MSANVETMFYVREKPWHGLGTSVEEAPTSADALIYAGLDWEVMQEDVYTEGGILVPGYKVNLRSTDAVALGIVSDRCIIAGDEIAPYLVVMNPHDGSSGIKVAMTPIRIA